MVDGTGTLAGTAIPGVVAGVRGGLLAGRRLAVTAAPGRRSVTGVGLTGLVPAGPDVGAGAGLRGRRGGGVRGRGLWVGAGVRGAAVTGGGAGETRAAGGAGESVRGAGDPLGAHAAGETR